MSERSRSRRCSFGSTFRRPAKLFQIVESEYEVLRERMGQIRLKLFCVRHRTEVVRNSILMYTTSREGAIPTIPRVAETADPCTPVDSSQRSQMTKNRPDLDFRCSRKLRAC